VEQASTVQPCLNGKVARILRKRKTGAIVFLTVRACESAHQIALTQSDTLNFASAKSIPTGSLVRLFGEWGISRNGTPTFFTNRIDLLHGFTGTMPDKVHGIDNNSRHFDRALDLAVNDAFFGFVLQCADMTAALREVLRKYGFREFNTGVLQRTFEAGLAKPFTTVCNANGATYSLSLTSELKLKRLLAAGAERVCEIAQSFRNEGISRVHSPEFTLLEAYGTDMTYFDFMEIAENMVRRVAETIPVSFAEYGISPAPFARRTYMQICESVLGTPMPTLGELSERFPDQFVEGMPHFTWVMKLLERIIGPRLIEPVFVTELPTGLSPFVRRAAHDARVTERAFLFANGLFLCDLYTDESDPDKLECELRVQAGMVGRDVDIEQLRHLRLGMPPTAGMGLGVNRLHMLFKPKELPNHIRETILFPLA